MSYLFTAIVLYFLGGLVSIGILLLGVYKDSILILITGWAVGVVAEFSAVIYSILWIVWLFKG